MTRKPLLASLALVAALAACVEDETLNPPTANADLVDPLFARYVAFGNSITAGFESGGINDSTQQESFAVLLAAQMGTEFNIPLLNKPGCPPPLVNIFTQELVGNPGPLGCALRHPTIPERLNLVAIPGAAVLDIYDPLGTGNRSNTLTSIMGGGRSQIENAAETQPTFVTVWIGNNDALGAALNGSNPGDPALVTPTETFAARYGAMIDSIQAFGTVEGGVLMGAVQVAYAPYFTAGLAWEQFEAGFDFKFDFTLDSIFQSKFGAPLSITANIFDVATNCSATAAIPGGGTAYTMVPFPVGATTLATANARSQDTAVVNAIFRVALGVPGATLPTPTTLDCTDDKAILPAEVLNLFGAVTAYNATIEAAAEDLGWAFWDPNDLLAQLLGTAGAIFPFPAFPGVPGYPAGATVNMPFGFALSRDGIHPSASTMELVADELIALINATYETSIPARD